MSIIIENITFDFSHFDKKKEVVDTNYEISDEFIRLHKFYSKFSEHDDGLRSGGWLIKLYKQIEEEVHLLEFFDEDVINSPGFCFDSNNLFYEFGYYLNTSKNRERINTLFFKRLKENGEFYYKNRYVILKFLQQKLRSWEIEIGNDDKLDEIKFQNMIRFFIDSNGLLYIQRALNTIEIQKQHLDVIVIIVPNWNHTLEQFLIRKNYIERTDSALRELLQFKVRNEENVFFDYLFPNVCNDDYDLMDWEN